MKITIKQSSFAACLWFLLVATLQCNDLSASPSKTTYHIKIDQFGYFPFSKKVAVVADPQVGLNASESFVPGTGANQYQVRRWSDDSIFYRGTLQVWNGGATHAQSGDRGWWFDFSAVSTPGTYYVFDVANNIGSFPFRIGNDVYEAVLKQAMRTFFYQRINFAKQSPYTDAKWADGACFEGTNQDRFATSRFAKGDLSTARDVSGGWMDAGDKNKYTTFALAPVIQLMEAYRMNPAVFKDDYGIPESGNGLPDILDEVKWELDFLKRMQDATGTNGFFLKVGVDNNNEVYPPSADKRARYYLPECTSSTIAGCAAFAASGMVLKGVPQLSAYGADLIERAKKAWERAKLTTNNFTAFQTDCDDQNIKSGDADQTAERQLDNAVVAAVYLYEATGNPEYKTFAEANYARVHLYAIKWWGPYWVPQQLALLRLTTLPGLSSAVVNNIRAMKAGMDYQNSLTSYNSATDLYRSQMDDASYVWGHNQTRANAGNTNLDYISFNINADRAKQYKEVAEQYLHWMHGVNPMGMVMLTNMYQYGASKCANEIFHYWFKDGTAWDNAQTSTYGPPPGYVPGGPNKKYTGPTAGITDQPHQKAYKDWNTDWPENSWEVTEPAIYYQASYIAMLSRLLPEPTVQQGADTIPPATPQNLRAENVKQTSITLRWDAATDNIGVKGYTVYQDSIPVASVIANTFIDLTGLTCDTAYAFRVEAIDSANNVSEGSQVLSMQTGSCLFAVTSFIYEDSLRAEWKNVSVNSSLVYTSADIVKSGSFAIRNVYAPQGTMIFERDLAFQTNSNTQLRFWVYNTGKTGIRIFTKDPDGVNSKEVLATPGRNKWQEVIISMSQLGNPASIESIHIQNNSTAAATYYFDQVQLTNVNSSREALAQPALPGVNRDPVWKVFPNPSAGRFNLHVDAQSGTLARVEVFDLTGRKLLEKNLAVEAGTNTLSLLMPRLKTGQYILHYTAGAVKKVEKLLINL